MEKHATVRVRIPEARQLADEYHAVAHRIERSAVEIGPLLRDASLLLDEAVTASNEFLAVALELRAEGRDVAMRADLIEQGDRALAMTLNRLGALTTTHSLTDSLGPGDARWRYGPALSELNPAELLALLDSMDDPKQLSDLFNELLKNGETVELLDALGDEGALGELTRGALARSVLVAFDGGEMELADGSLPIWLVVGAALNGNPSDATMVSLAVQTFDAAPTPWGSGPDPFAVAELDVHPFLLLASRMEQSPAQAREFVLSLVDEHGDTGDSRLNIHADSDGFADTLGRLTVIGGGHGDPAAKAEYATRVINMLNADDDTNLAVFTAGWWLYAQQVEAGVAVPEPTFQKHSAIPDAIRPQWQHFWNEELSPVLLRQGMHEARKTIEGGKEMFAVAETINGLQPEKLPGTIIDWLFSETTGPVQGGISGGGGDAGGTYTSRPIGVFPGASSDLSEVEAAKAAIAYSLIEGSDRGEIAQDEFGIIDHGIGPNGKPTYTINLPGVIDLSNPNPGWDERHQSVRDMDMAAHESAPTASVEDNLYAEMVKRSLDRNGIQRGANLLLVGHSFGADTVADLATDADFASSFNVTHVVAAAYDSVPQLAHIDPSIEVLVLQNNQDVAIALERMQRHLSSADEQISAYTFAHEVRTFDGGFAMGGHHQDTYIAYLDNTSDTVLDNYLHSIADMGYTQPGTSRAIDVSIDRRLVAP